MGNLRSGSDKVLQKKEFCYGRTDTRSAQKMAATSSQLFYTRSDDYCMGVTSAFAADPR